MRGSGRLAATTASRQRAEAQEGERAGGRDHVDEARGAAGAAASRVTVTSGPLDAVEAYRRTRLLRRLPV